ncbi:MAG: 50S ribosomal protein L9 [Paludibacteraceae bacterium]|nr:50S ribosomal protein L9 [Paludibacteraceae bacterium]
MEIILKQDVANLGYKDDIVKVKDGYGRNYLLPQHLAVIATPSAKKQLEEELRQRAHKLAKIKADAEAQAATLKDVTLSIAVKVGEKNQVYGSVGAAQIAEALAAKGFEIDRKIISVPSVKTLGQHVATVRFHKEVSVEVPFEVIAEQAAAAE